MVTHPSTEQAYTSETGKIAQILQENGYHNQNLEALIQKRQRHKPQQQNTDPLKPKWALLIYSHNKVETVAKLLKNANIRIAYKAKNTSERSLNVKSQKDRYSNSGICQL
jgi:hypothetical protein